MRHATSFMIECVPTIDYEIYGNGEGSLRELVYDPAEKLATIFRKWKTRFVVFVEVAELEIIEAKNTDSAVGLVKDQIKDFYNEGFDLALHLHPHWYNARHENGKWLLDYSEYNLCTLPQERIFQIVDRSIAYLRRILDIPDFTPTSFRAGNWLFQPTRVVAEVLGERGIKVDSSVFKGGLQHQHKLDYRGAERNGYFWKFEEDVNNPNPNGKLLEIPIYTRMVPFWKMATMKRAGLQRKGPSVGQKGEQGLNRFVDFFRFRYPLKFDFCRMTITELTRMIDKVIQEDQQDPTSFRPIVAIGHTKDLIDYETVESFLDYLNEKRIRVSTFTEIYHKCT